MENDIQLKIKKSDKVIRIPIIDEDDNDTGECLQFDVEDVQTVLNLQECIEQHKKNVAYLKNQEVIIGKREDHKGKKLFTANQEAMAKAVQEFYAREIKAMDLFIGEGKTELILKIMKRRPYISMFNDIQEMLEPIFPVIKKGYEDYKKEIESKYSKEVDILE